MASNILLLESSGSVCSVALYDVEHDSLSLRESSSSFNHAVEMGLFVKELMTENQLDSDQLSAVAVSEGPGSYTGLRIGASLAKGICYGAKIPLIAISSLKSLASLALSEYEAGVLLLDSPQDSVIVSLTDARRVEVYRAVYDMELNCLMEPEAHILSEDSFIDFINAGKKLILVGDGAKKTEMCLSGYRGALVSTQILPSASGLARLAKDALENNNLVDTAYWEPKYLKDFVAKQSSKSILNQ